jgi:hypothetical protein
MRVGYPEDRPGPQDPASGADKVRSVCYQAGRTHGGRTMATGRGLQRTQAILGQPSWRLASKDVELFVTRAGGHTAPVTFHRRTRRLQPFSVAPWAENPPAGEPPIIQALRGDFFCMPFGGNARPWRGERHPIHGETANARWTLDGESHAGGRHELRLSLRTRIRRARVTKLLRLVDGHPALYVRHTVEGAAGPMDFGHHAMLRFAEAEGSGRVTTSRFVHGQVFPDAFERAEGYGYQSLRPGAVFRSLARVPRLDGTFADLTAYPARRGFEDLVMLVSDPRARLAWTAVTFPREGYAWFALRDPRVLASTVLWHSNGGRHYAPWSGRHVGVLGLEDVTACFHYGLAESAGPNPVAARGFRTCAVLRRDRPLVVPYVMAVALVPRGFDRVCAIRPAAGGVTLRADSGREVAVPLDVGFLHGLA